MPTRVLIAELKQETSTFNPVGARYGDFRVYKGTDILTAYRGTKTELAGAINLFESWGLEIVPTMAASAVPGGPVVSQDLERLLDELIDSVRKVGPVSAVYFCLHGAMAGEDEDDPEGRVLEEVRTIVGSIPMVASLDLHAVITERIIDGADVHVPFHTYPHTDQFETGQRAARLVRVILEGKVQPTKARVELPMLVRGDELLTATGLFGEAIRMCQEIEACPEGLAAGVIIGNAFTDVPALQSNVLVTTNDDPGQAQSEAERIGRFMWENREKLQAKLTPIGVAVEQARVGEGLTVFSDAADSTASGASGDSNAILKELLNSHFSKKALIPIVDEPAVATSFAAGVGADLAVPLGGTCDPSRFDPVSVDVRVISLHDGDFTYEDGTQGRAGRVAVLVSGTLSILVTERPVYFVGRRVYEAFGMDPREFDLVVAKSPNGFRTWYESIASLIVPVDAPGSTSANLKSLPFQRCLRPIFPLDADVPSPFSSS